jgi:hypothetical protein
MEIAELPNARIFRVCAKFCGIIRKWPLLARCFLNLLALEVLISRFEATDDLHCDTQPSVKSTQSHSTSRVAERINHPYIPGIKSTVQ